MPFGPPVFVVKFMTQADPRLTEQSVGPKHGTQSMCDVIPCPGRYSFTMSWSATRSMHPSSASRPASDCTQDGSGPRYIAGSTRRAL